MTYDVRFNATVSDEILVYSMKFGVEAASPEEAAVIVRAEMDEGEDDEDFGWYLSADSEYGDEGEAFIFDQGDSLVIDPVIVVTQTITFAITLKS